MVRRMRAWGRNGDPLVAARLREPAGRAWDGKVSLWPHGTAGVPVRKGRSARLGAEGDELFLEVQTYGVESMGLRAGSVAARDSVEVWGEGGEIWKETFARGDNRNSYLKLCNATHDHPLVSDEPLPRCVLRLCSLMMQPCNAQ